MNLFTCYNAERENEEDPLIDIENMFHPEVVRGIGNNIYNNQLKTQSRVTSIYGCNLTGVHSEIRDNKIDANTIKGKQLILSVPDVTFIGHDIGSVVIANIGKVPLPKISKEWNGKGLGMGMQLDIVSEKHFHGFILPTAKLTFDCLVGHLTVTNCRDLNIIVKGRIKTSIELINCSNVKVTSGGFYFIRITSSDIIKIWGQLGQGGIFDVRNSKGLLWYNLDIPCNEFTSQRFRFDKSIKSLIPLDSIYDSGSHIFPTTQIGWNFSK